MYSDLQSEVTACMGDHGDPLTFFHGLGWVTPRQFRP